MNEHVWQVIDPVDDPAEMCVECHACKCCDPRPEGCRGFDIEDFDV